MLGYPALDSGVHIPPSSSSSSPDSALIRTESDVALCLFPQGTSTKYSPQRVGLTHTMEHEDVIQIVKK